MDELRMDLAVLKKVQADMSSAWKAVETPLVSGGIFRALEVIDSVVREAEVRVAQ